MNLIEYSAQTHLIIKNEIVNGEQCVMKVATHSMTPLIKKGSKLRIKRCSLGDLLFGDICVYEDGLNFVAHRYLKQKRLKDGIRYILTKGDANSWFDKLVSEKRLTGKVIAIKNYGSEIGLETRSGYLKSIALFFYSFICNIFKYIRVIVKRFLVKLVVYLGRLRGFRIFFSFIYNTAFKIIVLFLKKNKNVLSIYAVGSFITDLWVPGVSDIDFVIVLDYIDSKNLTRLNRQHLFLKKFIPFLGEMSIHEKVYNNLYNLDKKLVYLNTRTTTRSRKEHIKNNDSNLLFDLLNNIVFLGSRLTTSMIVFSSEPTGDLKAFRTILLTFKRICNIAMKGENGNLERYFGKPNKELYQLMNAVNATSIYEYHNGYSILSDIYSRYLYYLEELLQCLKMDTREETENIIDVIGSHLKYYNINDLNFNQEFANLKMDKLLIKTSDCNSKIYFNCSNGKQDKEQMKADLISFLKMLNGRQYFLCTDKSIIMNFLFFTGDPFDMFYFCQCQEKRIIEDRLKHNRLWNRIKTRRLKFDIFSLTTRLSSFSLNRQFNVSKLLDGIYKEILSLKLYREIGFIPFSFREAMDSVNSNYKDTGFAKELKYRFSEEVFSLEKRGEILDLHFKNYLFMYNVLREEEKISSLIFN